MQELTHYFVNITKFFTSEFTKIIVTTGWDGVNPLSSTEIIDLNGTCATSLPEYPMKLDGATGVYVDGKIIICGGGYPISNNKCYQLEKGGETFELVFTMEAEERYAESIVHQGYMLRTGGYHNGGDNLIGTAEFINHQISNNTAPKPKILLPEPVSQHAIFSINKSTSFLIGGITSSAAYSRATHLYNQFDKYNDNTKKWTAGPKLNIGRKDLTAGVLIDHETEQQHIAVVGGTNDEKLDSVELLLHGQDFWSKGTLIVIPEPAKQAKEQHSIIEQ